MSPQIVIFYNVVMPDRPRLRRGALDLPDIGVKIEDWGSELRGNASFTDAWEFGVPLEAGFKVGDKVSQVLSVTVAASNRETIRSRADDRPCVIRGRSGALKSVSMGIRLALGSILDSMEEQLLDWKPRIKNNKDALNKELDRWTGLGRVLQRAVYGAPVQLGWSDLEEFVVSRGPCRFGPGVGLGRMLGEQCSCGVLSFRNNAQKHYGDVVPESMWAPYVVHQLKNNCIHAFLAGEITYSGTGNVLVPACANDVDCSLDVWDTLILDHPVVDPDHVHDHVALVAAEEQMRAVAAAAAEKQTGAGAGVFPALANGEKGSLFVEAVERGEFHLCLATAGADEGPLLRLQRGTSVRGRVFACIGEYVGAETNAIAVLKRSLCTDPSPCCRSLLPEHGVASAGGHRNPSVFKQMSSEEILKQSTDIGKKFTNAQMQFIGRALDREDGAALCEAYPGTVKSATAAGIIANAARHCSGNAKCVALAQQRAMRDELLSNIRSALDDPLAAAGVGRPADEAPSDDELGQLAQLRARLPRGQRGEVSMSKRVGGPRMSLESTTKAVLTMILANDVGLSKPKPSGQSSAAAPPPGETVEPMAQLRCRLLGQMLERSFNALTFPYFKQIHTGQIQGLPEKKPTVWKAMESSGWYKAGLHGKAKETVLPKLLTIRKYSDIVPEPNVEVPTVPPEQWDRAALGCYANGNACRKRNVDIMISVLAAVPKPRGRKKRGMEPEVGDNAHLRAVGAFIKAAEHALEELLEGAREKPTVVPADAPAEKRRKIIVKRSASGGIDMAERSTPYTYKRTAARRFAEGPAAQGCPARVLHAMLQGTVDLDIHSAVLTIVWQLVEQLGMADKDLFKEELELLKRLAEDRGEVLRGELPDMGPQAAKRFVLETIGGSRSFDADAKPFAMKLQRVSRVLRWLACSALPEVYGSFCRGAALGDGEKTEKWPEGETFSAFYQRAEDYILREWHTWVLTQPVKHLSLHFDGVRISRDAVLARHASVADYAADASAHIAKETGFVVKINEKTHPTIAEALTSCGAWRSVDAAPRNLLKPAMVFCWRCGDAETPGFGATSVENNAASVEKGRTYAECCLSHGVSMTPQLGFDACEQGFYLLHMDGHGSPSCALVHAGAELDKATVYFCDKAGEMNLEELRDAVLVGRDSRLAVTFHIDLSPAPQAAGEDSGDASPLSELLNMMA
ncbi:unnamed protein product [Prorocentrum cordatum]|uniref:RNA-dependent RNA polymerase n=1 Tax=Prorocentrum cordatum TaxID=2364126 RepID=A0ABN9XSZ4_9DINO|nr:unnamed protein product [Polarella glacialis]